MSRNGRGMDGAWSAKTWLAVAWLAVGTGAAFAQMSESFEYGVPPPGWTKTNLLGGSGWYQLPIGVMPLPGWGNGTSSVPATANAGTHNAYCSWNTGGGAGEGYHNDQWLISPRLTGLTATSTVSYWLRFAFTNFPDTVYFRVSTNGPAPANFTFVPLTNVFARASHPNQFPPWSNHVVNVGALGIPAGTPIWIAIQEYEWDNTHNGAAIQLDVINSDLTAPPVVRTSPTSLTFTAYYEGADPAPQTFTLQGIGSSGMGFSSAVAFGAGPTSWLNVGGPASGTLGFQGSQVYTASVSVAGLDLGTYCATNVFTVPGATNNPLRVPITLNVIRRPQTISFPNPGPQYTTNQVGLAGTASSGLQVTFSVFSGPGSIVGATNLSFTGPGTVRVVAWQHGNTYYDVAPCVTQAMAVTKANATILFSDLSQPYDGAPHAPTVATEPPGLLVDLTCDGGPSWPVARGDYAVTGVVNDVLYAGTAATTFTIARGVQTIVFPEIEPQRATNRVALAATASSGLPVTFAVASGPGSIADGTNLTFSGVGDVAVVAAQTGDADYDAAPDATNVVKVYGVAPAIGPLAGGNAVTVSNGNFGAITNVLVGGVGVAPVSSGADWFTIVMPALDRSGPVDIVVQTTDSGGVTLANAYTYNPAGAIWNDGVKPGGPYVAGGVIHSLGVKSNGSIAAWGYNVDGQCTVPAPNADFTAVAAGYTHSLGLKSDGTIAAWGDEASGLCAVPAPNADFTAIAADNQHSLGLKSDGSIAAWGDNYYGQTDVPAPNADFMAVAAGSQHSLGLKSDGSIVAWGENTDGQATVPAPNADFVAVACRRYHSLGLKSDGTIVAWGRNTYGQCTVPAPNANFVAIAAGWYHSLGLKSDGTIVAWGWNIDGQTTVSEPNREFGQWACGVLPTNGSCAGGYEVVIAGTNLCNGSDVANVTLCGTAVQSVVSQTPTQIVVLAGAAAAAGIGDVAVQSTNFGTTVKSNAFDYLRAPQAPLAFAPASPQAYGTTNSLTVSGGSGTGTVSFTVLSGPGLIVDSSQLVATAGAGTVEIRATKAADDLYFEASATGTVAASMGVATVELGNLAQTYDGTPKGATATTVPEGLAVELTYDGGAPAPTDAGSYAVTGTVNDANYEGSATGTLEIAKAAAILDLGNLSQTYDGTPKIATATTAPAGLTVELTYDGNATAPTAAGSYVVTGTVVEANYAGSATGTMTIGKANQVIEDFLPANGSVFVMSAAVGLSATASSGLDVQFASTGGPAVLKGTNLTFSGGGEVVVYAMQAGDANWNPAPLASNVFTILGIYSIAVESPHGTAIPGTGAFARVQGTVLTNRIESPDTQGSTQYVCVGWALDGHEPASGTETQMEMTVTNDATLTWLWTTNYRLTTASAGNGLVQPESGWQPAGVATQVLAEADEYFVFANWTGDAAGGDNPLALTMDAAKSVTANFAALHTTNRPAPLWWLVAHGWTNDFETAVDEDPDEDGIPTGDEWVMGTDPMDRLSVLAFTHVDPAYGSNCWDTVWTNEEPPYDVVTNRECEIIGHVYRWRTSTGRVYGVQGTAGMHAPWLDLDGMTNLMPQGPELSVTNPATDPERRRHYRVRVRLP